MSKIEKKRRSFSATNMRLVLSLVLIVILIGMAGGFYMMYTSLKSMADEVAKVQSEAQSSDAKIQQLMSLQGQLKKHQSAVDKAAQIVAESRSYQYQNQIVNDLTRYADKAGVRVTSFNFQDSASGSASASAPSTSKSNAPAPTGADSNSYDQAPLNQAVSIKSTKVSIQLGEGIDYRNLLYFIHLIEQNITKMQISELSLSSSQSGEVGAQSLNLEVYIR